MEQMEQKMGSERGRDVVTKVSCNLESDEEELKIKIRFRKWGEILMGQGEE